jgi:hypothetical protein
MHMKCNGSIRCQKTSTSFSSIVKGFAGFSRMGWWEKGYGELDENTGEETVYIRVSG